MRGVCVVCGGAGGNSKTLEMGRKITCLNPDWTLEKDPVQTHSGCIVLWNFLSDVAVAYVTPLY